MNHPRPVRLGGSLVSSSPRLGFGTRKVRYRIWPTGVADLSFTTRHKQTKASLRFAVTHSLFQRRLNHDAVISGAFSFSQAASQNLDRERRACAHICPVSVSRAVLSHARTKQAKQPLPTSENLRRVRGRLLYLTKSILPTIGIPQILDPIAIRKKLKPVPLQPRHRHGISFYFTWLET